MENVGQLMSFFGSGKARLLLSTVWPRRPARWLAWGLDAVGRLQGSRGWAPAGLLWGEDPLLPGSGPHARVQ